MEKLDLKVQSSQAKSIGTILSITGAYIVVFYQWPPILFSRPLPNLHSFSVSLQSNWIVGGFLLATSSFLISLLYIVQVELVKSLYNSFYNVKKKINHFPCHQTWIIKDYPAEMVVTLFGCIFVTILSAIVALIVERDRNAWTLKPDVELITIVYSAVFMVSIRSVIYAWVCRIKGPVFVSTFRPLGMAFAVFMGVTFLKDTLHIGSVIGAVIIALGLYAHHKDLHIWRPLLPTKKILVSAAIGFDAGVLSCLEYVEDAPWAEDEEEKVASKVYAGFAGSTTMVSTHGNVAVMWGKANEVQIIEENVISRVDSSSDKVPLLQNKSMEV
ncbi:hypothetical protein HYC85_021319 [Camellia sinensis]|uniref:WAT1-related protein n=1 Tax=Camellia sinensis TaxID=4442 RepID=A0A7J7GHA7_CAMSI|nr:hypothetical protein HYC85_021319 [Camellia sinensis]